MLKKSASFVLTALRSLRGQAPALPDYGELSRGVPVPLFKQGQSPIGRDFGELPSTGSACDELSRVGPELAEGSRAATVPFARCGLAWGRVRLDAPGLGG
ncbi:MAG: hypothetical protein EWM72_00070 [Nitrospira sp.]|nr:MAG: hypothetical protein EWM72_00070 [Nitrospira sp.]